jgi:hypothetical protein
MTPKGEVYSFPDSFFGQFLLKKQTSVKRLEGREAPNDHKSKLERSNEMVRLPFRAAEYRLFACDVLSCFMRFAVL